MPTEPLPEVNVDIAIVTILREEYDAVLACLDNHQFAPGTAETPNLYVWEMGHIGSEIYSGNFRVVVAMALGPGEMSGVTVTSKTIERWNPRYVILVGVAGGLDKLLLQELIRGGSTKAMVNPGTDQETVRLGDVVVSSYIYGYEYGKIENGFKPRPDLTYPADNPVVAAAVTLSSEWKKEIGIASPDFDKVPNVHVGPVASGNKVVDDLSDPFVLAVWKAWPKLIAVEMEGAGMAHAIKTAREEGKVIGFAMVRGVCDIPSPKTCEMEGKQTTQRDNWKPYACAISARFTVSLIKNRWPVPPNGSVADNRHGINISNNICDLNENISALNENISRLVKAINSSPIPTKDGVEQLVQTIVKNQKIAVPHSIGLADSVMETLHAVSPVFATRYRGKAYRLVNTKFHANTLWQVARSSQSMTLRWSSETVDSVYFALSEQEAMAEVLNINDLQSDKKSEFLNNHSLVIASVSLQYVLDLNSPGVLGVLGVKQCSLFDTKVSHEIAERAFQSGYEAMLVPSRMGPFKLLVIFPSAIHVGSYVNI